MSSQSQSQTSSYLDTPRPIIKSLPNSLPKLVVPNCPPFTRLDFLPTSLKPLDFPIECLDEYESTAMNDKRLGKYTFKNMSFAYFSTEDVKPHPKTFTLFPF